MGYEGWTPEEKRKHEQGRALMQSARDNRRNRIEAEKRRAAFAVAAQNAAQKAADARFEQECDNKVRAFMEDFAGLLNKHDLTLVTLQNVYAGTAMPLFKLAIRNAYRSPDYIVSCTPGRGFSWKR